MRCDRGPRLNSNQIQCITGGNVKNSCLCMPLMYSRFAVIAIFFFYLVQIIIIILKHFSI